MSDKSGNKQLHYLFIHKGLTIIGIGIHLFRWKKKSIRVFYLFAFLNFCFIKGDQLQKFEIGRISSPPVTYQRNEGIYCFTQDLGIPSIGWNIDWQFFSGKTNGSIWQDLGNFFPLFISIPFVWGWPHSRQNSVKPIKSKFQINHTKVFLCILHVPFSLGNMNITWWTRWQR